MDYSKNGQFIFFESPWHIKESPGQPLFFYGRVLSNHLSFVIKLSFAHMRTVAYMALTGCFIRRDRSRFSFVVSSAFRASLLRMSAFGIWHNLFI
jgi:hypothetical protein